MFREQYKGAFDEIKGDRTQIARIFALAAEEEKPKRKVVVPFRAATAFAAVLVVAVSLYTYPDLLNTTKPQQKDLDVVNVSEYKYPTVENTVISSGAETGNEDIQSSDDIVSKEKRKEAEKSNQIAGNASEKQMFDVADASVVPETAAVNEKDNAAYVPAIAEDTAENYKLQKPAADTIAGNSGSVAPPSNGVVASKGSGSSPVSEKEDASEPMAQSANVLTTGRCAEESVLHSFSVDYGDGRTAVVTSFADSETIRNILSSETATYVGNNKVVILSTAGGYTVYAEKYAAYYKIEAIGLTEAELYSLIESELGK